MAVGRVDGGELVYRKAVVSRLPHPILSHLSLPTSVCAHKTNSLNLLFAFLVSKIIVFVLLPGSQPENCLLLLK